MSLMFNKCYKLKEIKGIENFNTNNVTDMSGMFKECKELESLNLSNFETLKVKDISFMFYKCNKLKYLNLLKMKISEKCKMENIFASSKNCNIITNDSKLNKLYKN